MKREYAEGFPPAYDEESELLILGSFPSVKSRAEGFYYGNPQNRFWRTVCAFFGEETPKSVPEKRAFLARRHIALWDVVVSCSVEGSSDASIEDAALADLPALLKGSRIRAIFCNGGTAFGLLKEHFPKLLPMSRRMCSTSPANPRFSAAEWERALGEIFGG